MHKIDVYHQPTTRQVVLVGDTHASSYYVSDLTKELEGIIKDHLGKSEQQLFGIGMLPHAVVIVDDDGKLEVSLASTEKKPASPPDTDPSRN